MTESLVIFPENYPAVKTALSMIERYPHEGGVTLVITGFHDLYRFYQEINEKVYGGKLEIIFFERYRGRAEQGNLAGKGWRYVNDLFRERRYLDRIFNEHFKEMTGCEIIFFSRSYDAYRYYLLNRLSRNNRLTYVPIDDKGGSRIYRYVSRRPAHLARLFGTDLTLIPGIGLGATQVLFAEVGPDLSRFADAAHFASWLNICPHNKVSGDKILSSHTGPGANRVAQALRWATQSLYRSNSYLGQYFRRLRARLGTPKAVTATAHKLARIIYYLITHQVSYDESLFAHFEQQHRRRLERRLRTQAKALGFQLVANAA